MKSDEDLTPFMEPAPTPEQLEEIAEKELLAALDKAGDQAGWILKDWLSDPKNKYHYEVLADYY
jgi:hypothetical protein